MKKTLILILLTALGLILTPAYGEAGVRGGELVPPKEIKRWVRPGTVPGLLYFERKHSLSVGDKGEERFDVSTTPPRCGATALVFDHARIVYKRKRFGEARIMQQPRAGCTRCSPLFVRWYHEPTGYLEYQVHVYRRRIEGKCH